jgi:myo-inositol-1(or 4)-monophosphatase
LPPEATPGISPELLQELRRSAEEGARRAGGVLARKFSGERTIELKGGIDLVTDADKAAEAELLAFLSSRYPEHAVLAEESGAHAGSALRWVVDPLDGTTNYAHRVPHFCVSVAVEQGGRVLAGAIYQPLLDELFSAAQGQGASLNGQAIRVSEVSTLRSALLSTGFPYDIHDKPEVPVGLFNRLIRHAQGIRRMGSAALDMAYVACGRFDGFFEFGLKPWDIAAGDILIREAGGQVARIDGAPFELSRGDVLACGAKLYPVLETSCQSFLREVAWK